MPEHSEKDYQQIEYIRTAARVGASKAKHLDPLQQRINVLLGYQGKTS